MGQLALCQEERDAYRDERDRLRTVNAKLLEALEAGGELWGWLPFDSGADIQEVAQRVAKLQRAALEEARK